MRKNLSTRRRSAPTAEPVAEPQPTPAIPAEVETFIERLEAIAEILERETEAVRSGRLDGLEEFVRLKKEADARLREVGVELSRTGFRMPGEGPLADRMQAVVMRISEAANRNAVALSSARNATDHVIDSIARAARSARSEGMYGRTGRQVDAYDRTVKGLDTRL